MLITAARLMTAEGEGLPVPAGYLDITDGVIDSVGAGAPPRQPEVELPDGYLLPGFVDLQVNGYFGEDLQTADAAGWAAVASGLPSTGTTSFLPTLITAPVDRLAAQLQTAAAIVPSLPAGGARVLGVHLEGPFLSPLRRGAHNAAWLTDPTPEAVEELIQAGGGLLRLVTLAPERPGALEAIDRLAAVGVLVSVGHSDATGAQVAAAADRGARMVTHLFNGPAAAQPPGTGRRRPGPHRRPADQRADRGPAPRRRAHLRAGVPRGTWADRAGYRRRGRPACRRGSTCSVASRSRCRPFQVPRRFAPTARWQAPRCGWTGRWPTWSRPASAWPRQWCRH